MTITRLAARSRYADMLGYSRLTCIGNSAWIAGCAPTDGDGNLIGGGSPYHQAKQCIAVIATALTEAGFRLDDVVRTRIYIRSFAHIGEIARAHREAFGTTRPACTVIAVADLVLPGMLVYIDADAQRA